MLAAFVESIFTPAAFDGAPLVPESSLGPALSSPEGTKISGFLDWTATLPDRNPTSWLDLADSAAKVIASAQGTSLHPLTLMVRLADTQIIVVLGRVLLQNLRKMVSLEDSETVSSGADKSAVERPPWMAILSRFCEQTLAQLPEVGLPSPGPTSVESSPLRLVGSCRPCRRSRDRPGIPSTDASSASSPSPRSEDSSDPKT